MGNLQNANGGQWDRGFRGGQVASSLAPAFGVGPGRGPAWLLGAPPGSVPVTSKDLRQEPPKGARTLGQGQGLLLDVATCDQWFWGQEGHLTHVLSPPRAHCAHDCPRRATHTHTAVPAHPATLHTPGPTPDTCPSLLTHMLLGKHMQIQANTCKLQHTHEMASTHT